MHAELIGRIPRRILTRNGFHCRRALATIRNCVRIGRYVIKQHFRERMELRGLFWPDVLYVIDKPDKIRGDGQDMYGRDRWLLSGDAADGLRIEMLCVLDFDQGNTTTVFITLYWQD